MKPVLRYLITFLFVFSFLANTLGQEKADVKFGKGISQFSAGDFKGALAAWTDLYNTGYRSASLAYNIGNAYFKLNNIPSAILFYERAYLLDPADENINYNLQIARTLNVDRFNEIPELFFVRWYHFIALSMRTNTWARISIISFILCLLLLSLYLYSSNYRYKIAGFWSSIFLIVVTILSLNFSVKNKNLVYDSHKAIIMTPAVSGKSSPDSSGTDLFVLHEGTKVSVEDHVGDWYDIRLSDGNKGWVPESALSII
jgi:tetratricopeptide (TPR) repeat protein